MISDVPKLPKFQSWITFIVVNIFSWNFIFKKYKFIQKDPVSRVDRIPENLTLVPPSKNKDFRGIFPVHSPFFGLLSSPKFPRSREGMYPRSSPRFLRNFGDIFPLFPVLHSQNFPVLAVLIIWHTLRDSPIFLAYFFISFFAQFYQLLLTGWLL